MKGGNGLLEKEARLAQQAVCVKQRQSQDLNPGLAQVVLLCPRLGQTPQ